jgi:hypothetical protein
MPNPPPAWPRALRPVDVAARWLDPETAARYVGLGAEAFKRRVKAGKMPPPSYAHGPRSPTWDRLALDAAMTSNAPSRHRPLSGAVNAALEQGRKKAQAALRR